MRFVSKIVQVLIALALVVSIGAGIGGSPAAAANNKPSDDLILINKATNQLAFYQDGKRIIINTVATGKDNKSNKTPEGTFKVVNKVKERPWYKDNIPGGHPKNPLGARWIGFSVPGTWGSETGNSYGIHGHAEGASWTIGRYISGGCIRMHNASVISLYSKVLNGTKVKIYNNKNKSFDQVAREMGVLKSSKAASVKEVKTKAKVVKWSGNTVKIEYGKNKTRKNLTTKNGWYKKNLKPGKTYMFYYKGSNITKVNQ